MKRGILTLTMAVVGTLWSSGSVVSAQPAPHSGSAIALDFGLFYDSLAPHGEWIETPQGWSWAPRVPADWRPYTRGQWLRTEDGWHWDSDEAFGWATFHYGRWRLDPGQGWLWSPGTDWAPAWVSWRHGNGFAGWAPLAPGGSATTRESIPTLAGSKQAQDYVFVHERTLVDRGIQARLLPRHRNVALFDATLDVTNYRIIDGRIANLGIEVENVEHAVGRPVPRVRTVDVEQSNAARRASAAEVRVFRPVVHVAPNLRPARGRSLVPVDDANRDYVLAQPVARLASSDGSIAFVHTADRSDQDPGAVVPSYTNAQVLSMSASQRTLVIRTADGVEQTVQLDDTLTSFGDVKVGDRVMLTLRSGPGWARVTTITRGLPNSSSPGPDKTRAPVAPVVDAEALGFARTTFDSRVAALAQQAERVDRVWGEFVTTCKVEGVTHKDGGRDWFALWEGTLRSDLSSGFCRDLFNQIVNLGEPIKQGMTAAEDVARRSLDPGDLREIRTRYTMNWGGWALPRPAPLEQ